MDRINASSPTQSSSGAFPINQALRAYSQTPRTNRPGGSPFVQSVQPMRPVAPTEKTSPLQNTNAIKPTRPSDSIAKIAPAPTKPALDSTKVNQLIGAKVQPIDLTNDITSIKGPKPVTTSAGTYTLYPQAADRIQAATNISYNSQLGRSLDISG
jgi:hypothetical protein